MNYPKVKYHAECPAITVHGEDQESELGSGWEDSPAAFGTITQPSAEQARQIALESEDEPQKRKPGRPKKEE